MGSIAIEDLTQTDVAAIEALADPWMAACIDRDWDAALAMCTDDCTFLPPGEPRVSSEGLRAFFEAFPVIKTFTFSFDHIEGRADLAVAHGPVDMRIETEEGEARMLGKFVDIFRKDDNGAWKFSGIIWNQDA